MEWLESAACRGLETEIWYPLDDDDGTAGYNQDDYDLAYGEAKRICGSCPVREECLRHALDRKERWGCWGGLIPIERLRIERKHRRQRLRKRREAEAQATADNTLTVEPW